MNYIVLKQSVFSKFAPLLGVFFCLFFYSCQELQSEKANNPKQVVSPANSTITGTGGEVGVSQSVRVRLLNSNKAGLFKVVPTIVAVNGSGASVAGISSGGCSATDGSGYSTCSITSNVPGTYTLKVTSPVAFAGGSISFTQISRSVRFITQPSISAGASVALATQPAVELLDRVGNRNITGTDSISMALTSAGSATLGGTTSVAATAGVATFVGLNINLTGSYTLTASGGSLTSATSSAITITSGAASKLGFIRQPSTSTAANIGFAIQPQVAVQDSAGNTVSSNCIVTIGYASPNGASDTFAGTFSRSAVAGISDFTGANLRVLTTLGGSNYTLSATASGPSGCAALTATTSSTFQITLAGVPDHLEVVTEPGNASLGQIFPTQPVIRVLDVFGNLASSDNTTVVTIAKAAGAPAGPLAGSLSLRVTNGTATFTNLYINSTTPAQAGTYGYDFSGISTTTIIGASSAGQTITADGLISPFSFGFLVQPSNVSRGATMPSVQVQRLDANGSLNTSDSTTTVQLTINSGLGVLAGGTARALVNGVATFSALSISGASGAHTLSASLGAGVATTSGVSNSFAVSDFGTATRLAFTQQPVASTVSGTFSTQPIVTIQDVSGNTVSSDNSSVITIRVSASAGTATLTGTVTATAVNGVATFSSLGISEQGVTGIVLEANSSSGQANAQSNSFNGRPYPATSLEFSRQPVAGAGAAWSTQPIVSILDSQGDVVATDNTTVVTISLYSFSGGATTLSGTLTGTAVNGLVTFVDIGTNETARTNIVIQAAAAGLGSVRSSSFTGRP